MFLETIFFQIVIFQNNASTIETYPTWVYMLGINQGWHAHRLNIIQLCLFYIVKYC